MQVSGGRKILLRFSTNFVEMEETQSFPMLIPSTVNLVISINAQNQVYKYERLEYKAL